MEEGVKKTINLNQNRIKTVSFSMSVFQIHTEGFSIFLVNVFFEVKRVKTANKTIAKTKKSKELYVTNGRH